MIIVLVILAAVQVVVEGALETHQAAEAAVVATKCNKPINFAPSAPDSLHYTTLRSSCWLLRR